MKGYVYIALSVDGFIAAKDGGLDWLNSQPVVEGEDYGFAEFLASMDAMILGRNTFDMVTGFGKDAWAYGELPVFVWTRNANKVRVPDWVPQSVRVLPVPWRSGNRSNPVAMKMFTWTVEQQYAPSSMPD